MLVLVLPGLVVRIKVALHLAEPHDSSTCTPCHPLFIVDIPPYRDLGIHLIQFWERHTGESVETGKLSGAKL